MVKWIVIALFAGVILLGAFAMCDVSKRADEQMEEIFRREHDENRDFESKR